MIGPLGAEATETFMVDNAVLPGYLRSKANHRSTVEQRLCSAFGGHRGRKREITCTGTCVQVRSYQKEVRTVFCQH